MSKKLRPRSLISVLLEKYHFPASNAQVIADFLLPMLALDPNARITAGELLHHKWLRDVPHSQYPFENQYPPDATMSVGVFV
jgi:serine/threonine protein kinase